MRRPSHHTDRHGKGDDLKLILDLLCTQVDTLLLPTDKSIFKKWFRRKKRKRHQPTPCLNLYQQSSIQWLDLTKSIIGHSSATCKLKSYQVWNHTNSNQCAWNKSVSNGTDDGSYRPRMHGEDHLTYFERRVFLERKQSIRKMHFDSTL